ncbi:MAG TPA: hypothetical protein VNN10_10615 [Dehalococcoidia bacterium]|nr:hypothetical protein [Dehalococcoidia bacterium]
MLGVLRALAFLSAFGFAFAAGAVAFRLGVQLTAAGRTGLAGVLYDFSAVFTSSFRRFETMAVPQEATVVEFASLIALEAYLLVGFGVTLALVWLAGAAARYRLPAWDFVLDVAPLVAGLESLGRWTARLVTRPARAPAGAPRPLRAEGSRRPVR